MLLAIYTLTTLGVVGIMVVMFVRYSAVTKEITSLRRRIKKVEDENWEHWG